MKKFVKVVYDKYMDYQLPQVVILDESEIREWEWEAYLYSGGSVVSTKVLTKNEAFLYVLETINDLVKRQLRKKTWCQGDTENTSIINDLITKFRECYK